jgi:predicted RNase H-like nuclease (RuvC/YqgF family)
MEHSTSAETISSLEAILAPLQQKYRESCQREGYMKTQSLSDQETIEALGTKNKALQAELEVLRAESKVLRAGSKQVEMLEVEADAARKLAAKLENKYAQVRRVFHQYRVDNKYRKTHGFEDHISLKGISEDSAGNSTRHVCFRWSHIAL